ncbi:MAG: AAA family ATPase, partial [Verrucomicrobiota bacterium]|nr:AAA family ATPase [Verrucomicrobiota bacterium]
MITKLHINNFRCLVNFDATFDPFTVLCGHNGSGKTSVFQALRFVRALATGDGLLGTPSAEPNLDLLHLEFTRFPGQDSGSRVQEFELEIAEAGHLFCYTIHVEQTDPREKPRIVKERVLC